MNNRLTLISHDVDICVIGGGIGGMFSAISAARHGAKARFLPRRDSNHGIFRKATELCRKNE